jgi:hypothetical protein
MLCREVKAVSTATAASSRVWKSVCNEAISLAVEPFTKFTLPF